MATTDRGVPYPTPGDPDDVPADLYALAAWVNARPGIATMNATERDALTGADLWDGRVIYNTTTSRHEGWEAGTSSWRAVVALQEPNTWPGLQTFDGGIDVNDDATFDDVTVGGTLTVAVIAGAVATILAGKAEKTLGGAETTAVPGQTTGSVTLDCSAASIFTITPTGNITLAPSNVPASGVSCTITVRVLQGATPRTITLPAGGAWMGPQPVQVANKRCTVTMMTVDSGTTWDCSGVVQS